MDKLTEIDLNSIPWKTIKKENLDLEYGIAFPSRIAKTIFAELEDKLDYFTGDLAQIK